jgi:CRP-like cAMP-binding protein
VQQVTAPRETSAISHGTIARGKSLPGKTPKAAVVAAVRKELPAAWEIHLTRTSSGKTVVECAANHTIFVQGQPADAVFFLLRGRVKLAVASQDGKEAILATLSSGEFFGEGCLAGQPLRLATAISVSDCTLVRVEKPLMVRLIHEDQGLAEVFVAHLLSRITRYEADLVDQLFNSSEKRLARLLLLLSHFGKESTTESVVPGINQEHLAQMVGTTRSRINHFMNKFRDLGFIAYSTDAGLTVRRGLLSVVLND